ncbi:hypothetical protein DXG01_008758 [Tephrocybe rancida]|nr:hypothetical protein DXG01_008758 [Tephrocybe rancida]
MAVTAMLSVISGIMLCYLIMRDSASRSRINQHRKRVFPSQDEQKHTKPWALAGCKVYQENPRHGRWMLDWHITELRRYYPSRSEGWPSHCVVARIESQDSAVSVLLKISRTPFGIAPDCITTTDAWPAGTQETETVDFRSKPWCPDLVALFLLLSQEVSLKDPGGHPRQDSWYADVIMRTLDAIGTDGEERQSGDETSSVPQQSDDAVSKILEGYWSDRSRLVSR